MTAAAIIVAAGRGTRAGGDLPKQWQPLAGDTVAAQTFRIFQQYSGIDEIVVVLHPDDAPRGADFVAAGARIVMGGADRAGSVRAGLDALAGRGITRVLIHDVARPCLPPALITRVLEALDRTPGAAPALAVTDALWTGAEDRVTGTRDRAGLFRAQTPQGFDYEALCAAHAAHPGGAADDVEVARAAGMEVAIVPGDARNIKITMPGDFARAEQILRSDRMDIRLGNGFDVHRFGPGEHVTLCGVNVPFDKGLMGHSDADVGMHALTDAIYGALADGDIGQHFPPSDPQWKGAASDIFLRHAVDRAAARGYRIANADVTLICEFPKIGPHAARMRCVLADLMGLRDDQVSVKATTSEQLGFTGRGEGIAALASACLVAR